MILFWTSSQLSVLFLNCSLVHLICKFASVCCGWLGDLQHKHRIQRESENPASHDSNHNTARTGGDLAALRHRLNNDSSPADLSDLEMQHIFFSRKDDDTARFETGASTTPKEPTTNHNAWSLIVAYFEYSNMARICTKLYLQEFANNRRSFKL